MDHESPVEGVGHLVGRESKNAVGLAIFEIGISGFGTSWHLALDT
jgi:hypothetical protein